MSNKADAEHIYKAKREKKNKITKEQRAKANKEKAK